jgi:hypothetical protein
MTGARYRRVFLLLFGVLTSAFWAAACGGPPPEVLTEQYGEEMEAAFNRYYDIVGTWAPYDNPDLLREVMAGAELRSAVRMLEKELAAADRVTIIDHVDLKELRVLSYSPRRAVIRVSYRMVDYGASLETRERLGPLVPLDVDATMTFVREDGMWKLTGHQPHWDD